MDLTSPRYIQSPPLFASHGETTPLEGDTSTSLSGNSKGNPFADTFPDPLCKLNLKETSEFVKSFPEGGRGFLDVSAQGQKRREGNGNGIGIGIGIGIGMMSSVAQRKLEAPPTPGRPVFSFGVSGNLTRKTFPSKWDDAEKWLISSTSSHESPAHPIKPPSDKDSSSKLSKQCDDVKVKQQVEEVFAEKCRVTQEKVSKVALDHHNSATPFNGVVFASADVLLKDKFTDGVDPIFPNFRYSEPTKEGFLFGNSVDESMKDAATEVFHEVHHRDIGTEMTPIGSSTVSRCHTPIKSSSPARHNTPANRSGPLALVGSSNSTNTTIDISQLQECHLAKLQLGTQFDSVGSHWSSREEEEEEVSKSLRHCETGNFYRKSISEAKSASWEEEEKTKCCLRYQREEAKIQAWVNLQKAKAEAQSRKLEVKIQKMKSNLEEKLMKRMAVVHRKAEEWRASAQVQHSEQIQRAAEQAQKMLLNQHNSNFSPHSSCGCFPCSNLHH